MDMMNPRIRKFYESRGILMNEQVNTVEVPSNTAHVTIVEEVVKSKRKKLEDIIDDLEGYDIIDYIISNKPSVTDTRKLLRKYADDE